MNKFVAIPITVDAIQFSGFHDSGTQILKAFPKEDLTLEYVYGRAHFRLKYLNKMDQRYYIVNPTDYVVRGAMDEIFIYRENLFQRLFVPIVASPAD